MKHLWLVVALAGCGKGGAEKAAFEAAIPTIDGIVKELAGKKGAFLEVPKQVDLSTIPELADRCVQAMKIVGKLAPLAANEDPTLKLLGTVAKKGLELTEVSCKDVTLGEAITCWEPCTTEWIHFEAAHETFAKRAQDQGLVVRALQ